MADVAGISTTVSQMTAGAFDATVLPLKKLWKDAAQRGRLPDNGAIVDVLGRMGWGYMNLVRTPDNHWQIARTRPGMQLDFGGIVKGWSVGEALNYLADRGVKSALVQVGGEIALLGNAPTGKPWHIGIRHPINKDENWTVLTITGRTAVSTSGNYEQPIKIGGIDYYHIFDPVTGQPIPTNVLGTTVVVTGGKNPNALADGLATAFSVMGPDKALAAAAKMTGVDVLFIVRDSATGEPKEIKTPGFDRYRPDAD
jgi:thiamine biosynthesis lipoprotein